MLKLTLEVKFGDRFQSVFQNITGRNITRTAMRNLVYGISANLTQATDLHATPKNYSTKEIATFTKSILSGRFQIPLSF